MILLIAFVFRLFFPNLTIFRVRPFAVELGFGEIEKIKKETQKESTKPPPETIEELKAENLRLYKIIAVTASIGSSQISPDDASELRFYLIDLSGEALEEVKKADPVSGIIPITEKFLPNNRYP